MVVLGNRLIVKSLQTRIHDVWGALRPLISGLARYGVLKAWVSCDTNVAVFQRCCIIMVTYTAPTEPGQVEVIS